MNLETAKRLVASLEQCQHSYLELTQGLQTVLAQCDEQQRSQVIETGNVILAEPTRPDAMHEWLNSIESEFSWLRQRLGNHTV